MMTRAQVETLVGRLTGRDIEQELDAIFGPVRGLVSAAWLNERFHPQFLNFLPMNNKHIDRHSGGAVASSVLKSSGAIKAGKGAK